MIQIRRDTSDNKDFKDLVKLLDDELNLRYGIIQIQYDKYNKIEFFNTIVICYLDNNPIGCGCFKAVDNDTLEIKRMFVKPENRGKGIAKMILMELEKWAFEKGFSTLILETGIKQPEAISLYSKLGYCKIDNYGQYIGNDNSVCMSKELKNNKHVA